MSKPTQILTILALAASPLHAQGNDVSKFLIADRAAEVALARTAAPAHVSDSATVLVLERTGYVEAVRGTNGFTCVVIRPPFILDARDSTAWETRARAPHCFNPAATVSILEEMKLRSRLVMAGTPPEEIARQVTRALERRTIPAPGPTAMAYMQSKHQWLFAEDPDWHPHVMFYYPGGTDLKVFGADRSFTIPVINGTEPRLTWQVILVPVPQWSDGTLEVAAHTH
jgi:hypothetical protein